MGHLQFKNHVYTALRERLDKNPIGLPEDINLYEILNFLFTPDEAKLSSLLPLSPATFEQLQALSGLDQEYLKRLIHDLKFKGVILEVGKSKSPRYVLSTAITGFFEFVFMRTNQTLPLKKMAELINGYRLGDPFTREFFREGTSRARNLIHDTARLEIKTEMITYEHAKYLAKESGRGALTTCYCRHEGSHLNHNCKYPMRDMCISLGNASDFLVEQGFSRRADMSEILEKIDQSRDLGLVLICDNVRGNVTFICSCCGCCCVFLNGITKKNLKHVVATTNFQAQIQSNKCTYPSCRLCMERCQIKAIGENNSIFINEEICLGCGICSSSCPNKAIIMKSREKRIIPPESMRDLYNRLLKERGRPVLSA